MLIPVALVYQAIGFCSGMAKIMNFSEICHMLCVKVAHKPPLSYLMSLYVHGSHENSSTGVRSKAQ